MWLVLGDLGLVPMWVAIVFLVRGAVVDTIRYTSRKPGTTVFGMMVSPWGQFIVGGRLMRGLPVVIEFLVGHRMIGRLQVSFRSR